MAKLSDTQLIVLSKAAARNDGTAIIPEGLNKAAATKVGASRPGLRRLLGSPEELTSILPAKCDRAAIVASAVRKAKDFASLSAADLGLALNSFVSRISVLSDHVAITIHRHALAAWILGVISAESDDGQSTIIITAPIRLQQRGQEMRLVFGGEDGLPNGNTGLVRLLARAHSIRRSLFDDRMTIGEIAQASDLIPSYVTRLVRLTFLAPDITASILSGRHDPDLTVSRLMADTRFPIDWDDQRPFFASL